MFRARSPKANVTLEQWIGMNKGIMEGKDVPRDVQATATGSAAGRETFRPTCHGRALRVRVFE